MLQQPKQEVKEKQLTEKGKYFIDTFSIVTTEKLLEH